MRVVSMRVISMRVISIRITGLLALSFLCLISFALVSVGAAPANEQASGSNAPVSKIAPCASSSPALADLSRADSVSETKLRDPADGLVSADALDKRYGILRSDPKEDTDSLASPAQRYFERMKQEEEGVCYKLRSYKVARDDRDSDSTHPVGYSTCQRASKFQMKSAEGR
jgi:hypothetical protein